MNELDPDDIPKKKMNNANEKELKHHRHTNQGPRQVSLEDYFQLTVRD
jgi:hypothetical protein